jgi:hypothetical protein
MLVTFEDVPHGGTRTEPMQDTVDLKSIVRFHAVKDRVGEVIGTKLYMADGSSVLVGNTELEVMEILEFCGETIANAVDILRRIERHELRHPSLRNT